MVVHTVNQRDRDLFIAKSTDTKTDAGSVPLMSVWFTEDDKKLYVYTGSDNDGWVEITSLSGAFALLALRSQG